jgi:hypothetical protein
LTPIVIRTSSRTDRIDLRAAGAGRYGQSSTNLATLDGDRGARPKEALQMSLKYFDSTVGAERFKRRYVWAFWAYLIGFASGLLLLSLVH